MKRTLALVLALALCVCLIPAAQGADASGQRARAEAADALYRLGLFKGTGSNEDGTPIFDLDRAPTRQEAVTMLVRLLGREEEALAGDWTLPFEDVDGWAVPYVGYAYANRISNGTSATTFGGRDTVTATQYLTFVLRALGYESGTDFQWDRAWELTDRLGLTHGEYNDATNTGFLRGDVALVSNGALDLERKGESVTLLTWATGKTGREEETAAAPEGGLNIDAVMAEADAVHRELTGRTFSGKELEAVLVNDPAAAALVTREEAAALMQGAPDVTPRTISNAQAVSDVDLLFRAFEAGYGAYYYFGKEKFEQAQAEVLSWLKGKEPVDVQDFDRVVQNAFTFVRDCHVSVGSGDRGVNFAVQYYYCPDQRYLSDDTGLYLDGSGERWYFQSFTDSRVRMEKTLTAEGEIVWSPVLLSTIGEFRESAVTLRAADGRTRTDALSWVHAESYLGRYSPDPDLQYWKENGIAYLSVRSCDSYYGEELLQFAATGADVRDASLIIYDIRGNGGGSEEYPSSWLVEYIGSCPPLPQVHATRFSPIRTAAAERGRLLQMSGVDGTFLPVAASGWWIDQNQIPIIVLVDKYVASGGESTLNFLRSMNHVLVVGSNTAGAQLCGNVVEMFLPNSKLRFAFGTSVSYLYDCESRDYLGYEPDLWCEPKTALEAVMNLAQSTGLADRDTASSMASGLKQEDLEWERITLEMLRPEGFPPIRLRPGERTGLAYVPEDDPCQGWYILVDGEHWWGEWSLEIADENVCGIRNELPDFNGFELKPTGRGTCKFFITVNGMKAEFYWLSG